MRNLKTIALGLVLALGTAVSAQTAKKVDVAKSNIHWVGKKFSGQHEGTVNLQEGTLMMISLVRRKIQRLN